MKLPIPLTVLTGFLGSGKTTLLKSLLDKPNMAGTAVIVNEFGDVGLDDALIEAAQEETVLLPSGCVCCAVRGDLVEALKGALRGSGIETFEKVLPAGESTKNWALLGDVLDWLLEGGAGRCRARAAPLRTGPCLHQRQEWGQTHPPAHSGARLPDAGHSPWLRQKSGRRFRPISGKAAPSLRASSGRKPYRYWVRHSSAQLGKGQAPLARGLSNGASVGTYGL